MYIVLFVSLCSTNIKKHLSNYIVVGNAGDYKKSCQILVFYTRLAEIVLFNKTIIILLYHTCIIKVFLMFTV